MIDELVTLENPIDGTVFEHVDEERLARTLGWLGIGLGMLELTRPAMIAAMLDVPRSSALIAAVGAREIASGLGILGSRRATAWLWARAAGGLMDLAVIATGIRGSSRGRGAALASSVVVAAVAALDVLCARELARVNGSDQGRHFSTAGHP